MVNKTFCDWCNKEIKNAVEVFYCKIIMRKVNEHNISHEICKDCKNRIESLIKNIREAIQ